MLICFLSVYLTEEETVGKEYCDCDVPCTKHQFEAVLSSSLLNMYKIKADVTSQDKSTDLLPHYQEALEISAQVCDSWATSLLS